MATPPPTDAPARADAAPIDAPPPWPQLASFPRAEPLRVIALPARPDVPRFDVGGPAIVGDVAVVASSQLGFAAVDWRRGQLAWTKPAGLHVAPPVARGTDAILVGECLAPPADVRDTLLGCLRVVTQTGADETYVAIHGAHVEAFAAEPGPQRTWIVDDHTLRWRRGEQAVSVDLLTGAAAPAPAAAPPLRVAYQGKAWDVAQTERGTIDARGVAATGARDWATKHPYTALLGAVYLRDLAPMVRVANVGAFGGLAELNLLDIDATGSLHGQAAFPVPAIGLLGSAVDAVGDTAIAVRMDASLHHDFVVGYAANALLMWVYPLPDAPRADPVGVAVAPDAVLAFHDGDTFTVLPELSAPPTAPGTPPSPAQNPTP